VLDVPIMLRTYYHTYESYALDYVASRMLGKGKTMARKGEAKIAEIDRLFAVDKPALAAYNLNDAVLTLEIFEQAGLLADAVERSKHSGHLLDRVGGSVAAFDYLYLPRLHREGYVAGEVADIPRPSTALPGGYVMDSKPGIYENVLLLDFKSLYPTIIKTFLIDPLGCVAPADNRVQAPVGPSFARSPTLLPHIIAELLEARAQAKATGNQPLSQAIKILMNSFYGVLGSTGCRFFSEELAGAITGTGRYILRTTCEHIERTTGLSVIYGDTDSLFVLLGPGRQDTAVRRGGEIVLETNGWLSGHLRSRYAVESALELEQECHFRYFLMPTIRGSTQGSKKRYCGAIERDGRLELRFKGMESARSDWTELAKEFQNELYCKVFERKPVEEYIVRMVEEVKQGKMDDKLVYRKHLRKPIAQYTGSVPPHVQAARLLPTPPRVVYYVITREGPQPANNRSSSLDYEHYIDCQLRPVADSVLEWVGLDFDTIVSGQQDLFGQL
ncbi:MAG: DNA polymerase II, partial [Chitinivibrionales bacterium]|nr:DNA polymerase II [Chitinivibrionales bacterium]MBD3356842.1 DNA polymerase II [Chitinivibrionales bacterium]